MSRQAGRVIEMIGSSEISPNEGESIVKESKRVPNAARKQ